MWATMLKYFRRYEGAHTAPRLNPAPKDVSRSGERGDGANQFDETSDLTVPRSGPGHTITPRPCRRSIFGPAAKWPRPSLLDMLRDDDQDGDES